MTWTTLLDRFTGRSDGSRMTSAEADEAVEHHRAERGNQTEPLAGI